jgi:hypothetical protein
MFTDTFGQENFLSDKRHSAGTRPPLMRVEAEKFPAVEK